MTTATISSKGQIVIPKNVRDALNMKPKQKVLFRVVKDHLEVVPLPENPVEAYCGIFKEGSSLVDALLKDRKEELKREEQKTA
jgi:AbrB family looped-hinge helix DNA binding protein